MAVAAAALAGAAMLGAGESLAMPEGPIPYNPYDSFTDPAWWGLDVGPFLGRRTGDYILPGERASDQVAEARTGPPGPRVLLGDGTRLLSGCRRHSCDEKVAVVLSPRDEVLAVGLVHFRCRLAGPHDPRRRHQRTECDEDQTLTLFLRPDGAWREAIERWAEGELGRKVRTEVVGV